MKKFLQIAALCAVVFGVAVSCEPQDNGFAPTGLTVKNITQSTATLSWSAVEGVEKYIVAIGEQELAEATGALYEASGLTAATKYAWKVQAVKGDTKSEWSAVSEFTTQAVSDVPAPTNLKAKNVTHNSATLSWQHPDADYHEVAVGNLEVVSTFDHTCQIDGLNTATEYTWKVRSRKDAVWSDWAEGDKFTTKTEPDTEFPYVLHGVCQGENNYGAGTSNFLIGFSTFEPSDEDSDGWECHLDLIASAVAVDYSTGQEYIDIPEGTYPIDTSGEAGTVNANQIKTYLTEWIRFSGYDHFITGGTVTVEGDRNDYIITFDLEIWGGTTYKGHYRGPMMIKNPAIPIVEPDLGTMSMPQGVKYSNDVYGDKGDVDNYAIIAVSQGVYIEGQNLMGTGTALAHINFFAPENSGPTIPDGTYNIEYSTAAGCVTMGFVNSNNQAAGLWVFRLDNNAIKAAPIVSGTVQTTYSDGIYTIVLNGKDDWGNDIVATIKGSGANPNPRLLPAFPNVSDLNVQQRRSRM